MGGRRGSGVEYDFDLGLSHARGRVHCGAGGGVYAGRRHDVCTGGDCRGFGCGWVCAAAEFFLQLAQQPDGGSCKVSRGTKDVGADYAGALWCEEGTELDAAVSYTDGGGNPDGGV